MVEAHLLDRISALEKIALTLLDGIREFKVQLENEQNQNAEKDATGWFYLDDKNYLERKILESRQFKTKEKW